MLGGRLSELFGAVVGSIIMHVVILILLVTVWSDSDSNEADSDDRQFVPATLVRDAPKLEDIKIAIKQKRERPKLNISSPVPVNSAISSEFSSNIDLDELEKLEESEDFDELTGLEDAEGLLRVAMDERDFILNYRALIRQRLERNWRQPPGTSLGTTAYFKVKFSQDGTINSYNMTRSSGNGRFDDSVRRSIALVRRIPEIQDIPEDIFAEYFADTVFRFRKG